MLQDLILGDYHRAQAGLDRIEAKLKWAIVVHLLAVLFCIMGLYMESLFMVFPVNDMVLTHTYAVFLLLGSMIAIGVGLIAFLNPVRPNQKVKAAPASQWMQEPSLVSGSMHQPHAYHAVLQAQVPDGVAHALTPWEKHMAAQTLYLSARHARTQRLYNILMWISLASFCTPIAAIAYRVYCMTRMEYKD
jgi:membrane protein required for beta-lactamase induction